MQISNGLGFYWTEVDRAQIGLDPRTGIALADFTTAELRLIDALTRTTTTVEYHYRAQQLGVTLERANQIVTLLQRTGVLDERTGSALDSGPHWRLHHQEHSRGQKHVALHYADQLGAGIGLGLANAGVGRITTTDRAAVGTADHPALRVDGLGLERASVFHQVLQNFVPADSHRKLADRRSITAATAAPDLVVLTGSHTVDPILVGEYLSHGTPVFLAWVEEVDIYVGPLLTPQTGLCGRCLYLYRCDADPAWNRLALQASVAVPAMAEATGLGLATALAVREIVNILDEAPSSLTNAMWRIPPAPGQPQLIELQPHPDCGCDDLAHLPIHPSCQPV
ncbi:MAG: hypothetical protein Q4E03_03255 [Trueperella sp.]|nr:hypothetical protein [Trueperella sp.]